MKRGDENLTVEKLGDLILDSERQLYLTAKGILFNEADVEDAVQEAILKAFERIHTLRKDRYARTWLIRILINECYMKLRSERQIISLEGSAETSSVETKQKEDYSDLYRALASLPEELRVPLVLYYINGFSIREIAGMMEITEGAVQKRLARARGKLKQDPALREHSCNS